MASETVLKTIKIAAGVCIVCSILVSTTAVALKSVQEKNKKNEKLVNILSVSSIKFDKNKIEEVYKNKIKPVVVDMESGDIVEDNKLDKNIKPENFDLKSIMKSNKYSKVLDKKEDIAGIRKMPRYMVVYLVKSDKGFSKIILPVFGKGLWSTMYGFIALKNDFKTIEGITFYEHGETPGLGGEVDNPRWKELWKGKLAYDDDFDLKIELIKGKVDKSSKDSIYKVDGLSGATLTTRGVNNFIRFWLGEKGYLRFLKKLKEEKSNV